MEVKKEFKGKVISINDGIMGMIKINTDTITPMQERRLRALGYTHIFETEVIEEKAEEVAEKVESHEPIAAKKPRKKKAQ